MKILLPALIHIIFWLVFVMINSAFGIESISSDLPAVKAPVLHYLINILWAAVTFYFFYFYNIRFFEHRQFIKYLTISVLSSIIIALIFLLVHQFFLPDFNFMNFQFSAPTMAGTFVIAQCGSLVKGFENWFANMQLKAELENLNLRNELELLKTQLNPHFLFNTLNNIDSLIFKSPSDASTALITLSDMLRYMIYETKQDLVPIEKEISHIKSYIQLQKIRFKNPEYVSFNYSENCKAIMIAPVLLLVFIENSFKYSCKNDKFPVIEIKLYCTGNELNFYCKNYFNPGNTLHGKAGGLGLVNVKRRLALLYPGKHELKITSENDTFIVDLKIKLI